GWSCRRNRPLAIPACAVLCAGVRPERCPWYSGCSFLPTRITRALRPADLWPELFFRGRFRSLSAVRESLSLPRKSASTPCEPSPSFPECHEERGRAGLLGAL